MSFVPEWAPSVHPMLVHFPVGLLFLAVLFDAVALTLRGRPVLRAVTAGLYATGAIAAVVAFYTGRQAAAGVLLPAQANPVLSDHADWALRTVWFYGLLALVRLAVAWRGWDGHAIVHGALLITGAVGLLLVIETGEHGAEMVFRYGVGVATVDTHGMQAHDHAAHGSAVHSDNAHGEEGREGEAREHEGGQEHSEKHEHDGAYGQGEEHAEGAEHGGEHEHGVAHEHGEGHGLEEGHHHDEEQEAETAEGEETAERAWTWKAHHDAEPEIRTRFRLLQGSWDRLAIAVDRDKEQGFVLGLGLDVGRIALKAGPTAGSVQVDAKVNLDGFDGRFDLLHNVSGEMEYGYLSVSRDGTVMLGRMRASGQETLESGRFAPGGWVDLRVVADEGHFRGYVNGKLVVHGHGSKLQSGSIGLAIEGPGTVLLRSMSVTPLR